MSFATPSRERTRPAVPLAAMIDVLFLLLIFFMTASVFREQDQLIDVDLPEAETATGVPSPTQITITIDPQDQIFIGEHRYTLSELRQTLGVLGLGRRAADMGELDRMAADV